MGLKVMSVNSQEPLTLDEAKLHLRVDWSEEDTLITALIRAAREQVEAFTRRSLISKTLELSLDAFPESTLELPAPPLQSVESIICIDSGGNEYMVSSSDYLVDTGALFGRVALKQGATWPAMELAAVNGFRVRFTAGYLPSELPESIKQAMLLLIGHWYAHREAVNIGNITTTLPFAVDALLWPYRVLVL